MVAYLERCDPDNVLAISLRSEIVIHCRSEEIVSRLFKGLEVLRLVYWDNILFITLS
jgi:hypothetical protein